MKLTLLHIFLKSVRRSLACLCIGTKLVCFASPLPFLPHSFKQLLSRNSPFIPDTHLLQGFHCLLTFDFILYHFNLIYLCASYLNDLKHYFSLLNFPIFTKSFIINIAHYNKTIACLFFLFLLKCVLQIQGISTRNFPHE